MSSRSKIARIFNGLRLPLFTTPRPLPGKGRLNDIVSALNSLLNVRVTRGTSDKVTITDSGTVIQLKASESSEQNTGAVSSYIVKEYLADYLRCRTWDEATETEGGTDVYIAKPRELRHSVTSEVIDGFTITYSSYSTASQTRHAYYNTTFQEDQAVVPRYLTAGDFPTIIRAQTVIGGTGVTVSGTALTLEDCNRGGRAWAVITDTPIS